VESLDLPVRLRSIGAGSFVADAERGAGVGPSVCAVGGAVVGEHTLDGDASVGEPGDRSAQDADRGGGFLVGADLCVGDAGVVVDDGVQERGADQGPVVVASLTGSLRLKARVGFALLAREELMPAAVGDVAELGHVDVDHRTGVIVFVAADRFPGDPVDVAESVESASHQNRVDGRGGNAELATDLRRAQPPSPPGFHDPSHHRRGSLGRHQPGSAGAVGHPGRPFGTESRRPFAGRERRHHKHLRGDSDRPSVLDDEPREP